MKTVPTPIERILLPTDFSDFSVHALRHGLALARRLKARLKVVHVIPSGFPSGESTGSAAAWPASAETRARIDEEMHRFLAPAREARVDHQTEVREGVPWREIVAQADELPADLVVMGTHGRSGLERFVLGSVTETVIHRLSCPVLTVCHEEGRVWGAPGLIGRILCATDFSLTSTEALGLALTFARMNDAPLTLLHVVEGVPDFSAAPYLGVPMVGPPRQDLEDQARERMADAIALVGGDAAEVDMQVAFGRAHREILKTAAENRADLVVIGAQGHGALEHLLAGSNAEHVIRGATCPVLTVRRSPARPRPDARPVGLALVPEAHHA